ncbi:MAG: nucleotide sugar dehydrogenase [Rhodospirillaceae bacterium]|jgi:UDP-N-acetyl-D-glucosamine dehydrogenase|nr:nucleotide sugar dehydrogenase [Rhodospirillaceae bacterium]MBT4219485.1 nucleotide sugar dehydrogenase [Rhodospirillaceae bacterium]MBT5309555.1 nucleotide sugar dehydrogenase [Rhodospirillaceae bacterium]
MTESSDLTALLGRLSDQAAQIGIVGLGYVGLPLAMACEKGGFEVTGFDIDQSKIAALEDGRSYLKTCSDDDIVTARSNNRFHASADFSGLADMDAIILCVPTPLTDNNEPDLSFITSTAATVAKYLRAGQLVVLESTTYPGTTSEVLKPILQAGGLKSGKDFFLAYSPEREDPGNATHGTADIPKVVGGDGTEALQLAEALYGRVVTRTVPVSSMEVAEAAKLTENIFRAVNIALVNELKLIYGKMGIDVWEVIDAAKSKPFGFMPFYPGPGLGGHCIPIDPFYLSWRARQFGQDARFIELAGEINTAMPGHVVETLGAALQDRQNKGLNGASILLIGVAYKKNVDDVRESPAFVLIEQLEAAGASVDYHDPLVPEIPITREHQELAGRASVVLTPDAIDGYDAVLICTDHDDIDYGQLLTSSRLVIDTRNAVAGLPESANKVVKA